MDGIVQFIIRHMTGLLPIFLCRRRIEKMTRMMMCMKRLLWRATTPRSMTTTMLMMNMWSSRTLCKVSVKSVVTCSLSWMDIFNKLKFEGLCKISDLMY